MVVGVGGEGGIETESDTWNLPTAFVGDEQALNDG